MNVGFWRCALLLFVATNLSAATYTLAPFSQLSGITGLADRDIYFAEFFKPVGSGTNPANYIILEGLSPITGTGNVFETRYEGRIAASGNVTDAGMLYLDLPPEALAPEGAVISPIVGVIPRSGGWSPYTVTPSPAAISGTAGIVSGKLRLKRTGQPNIDVPFVVKDANTIGLNAFSFPVGGTVFNFAATDLERDTARFVALLETQGAGLARNRLRMQLVVQDWPDANSDGLPDVNAPEPVDPMPTSPWELLPSIGGAKRTGTPGRPAFGVVVDGVWRNFYASGLRADIENPAAGWFYFGQARDGYFLVFSYELESWVAIRDEADGIVYELGATVEGGRWLRPGYGVLPAP